MNKEPIRTNLSLYVNASRNALDENERCSKMKESTRIRGGGVGGGGGGGCIKMCDIQGLSDAGGLPR